MNNTHLSKPITVAVLRYSVVDIHLLPDACDEFKYVYKSRTINRHLIHRLIQYDRLTNIKRLRLPKITRLTAIHTINNGSFDMMQYMLSLYHDTQTNYIKHVVTMVYDGALHMYRSHGEIAQMVIWMIDHFRLHNIDRILFATINHCPAVLEPILTHFGADRIENKLKLLSIALRSLGKSSRKSLRNSVPNILASKFLRDDVEIKEFIGSRQYDWDRRITVSTRNRLDEQVVSFLRERLSYRDQYLLS